MSIIASFCPKYLLSSGFPATDAVCICTDSPDQPMVNAQKTSDAGYGSADAALTPLDISRVIPTIARRHTHSVGITTFIASDIIEKKPTNAATENIEPAAVFIARQRSVNVGYVCERVLTVLFGTMLPLAPQAAMIKTDVSCAR